MSTTVYVVTDGEYSDYHICGIYSTKELAECSKELHRADNIEQYKLDDFNKCPEGMVPWSVRIGANGETQWDGESGVERESLTYFNFDDLGAWAPYGDGLAVCFHMFARDEAHAIKIANERRAQLIASGEWTTNWNEWKERKKGTE